jgi:4-hydroxybenzoate polyprenyltransferase
VIGVMFAYTPLLAGHGVLGNVAVGIVASLPFAYGAWAAGAPRASLPLLAVAIPLHVAREVAKDVEDAAADRMTRRTVPIAHGVHAARRLLIAALVVGLLALIPFGVERPWFAALIVPAIIAAALGTRRLFGGRRGAPTLYKIAMACAMVSLVLAHWR